MERSALGVLRDPCINSTLSTAVYRRLAVQQLLSDGISDGIRADFHCPTYEGQASPARLNIIARHVEGMLSTSQGVHQD